ncbi:hypothetical protein K502DRAFT_364647 [Neoconidiobolus thromboides FSU 785]|nr:hypothetical protein K502DRAFT_364647 [Neoconidiobolus thromboides FSU 785]
MEQLSYKDNLKDIYNLYKLTFNSISIANQSLSVIPKVKNVIYQTKYKLLLSLLWGLICIYYHQLLVYSPILFIVFTWALSIDSKLSIHLENSKEEAGIEKKIEGIQILFQEGKKMIHNVQEYKLIMIQRNKEISMAAIMGFPIWKFTVDIIPLNYLLLIAGNLILFETIEDYKKIRKLILITILNHTFVNTIINTLYDKVDKLKLFYLNIKDEELVLFNTNNISYSHGDRYNNKQLNYNTSMSIPVTPKHKLSHKFLDMNKSNSNPLPLNTSTTVTHKDNESSLQSLYSLPLSKQSQSYDYEYNIDNNKEGEINQTVERKELERVYSSTCSSTSSESLTPKPSEFMMPDYNQDINDDDSMEDKNISLLKIKFILFEYQRYHGKFGYLPQMLPNDPPNWVNNRNEPSQPKNLIELPLPTITYEIKENQKITNEYIWKWNTEWSFVDNESKELRDSEGWKYGDMKYGFHSDKEYVNYTFGLKKYQMRCRKWERVATLSKIVE